MKQLWESEFFSLCSTLLNTEEKIGIKYINILSVNI